MTGNLKNSLFSERIFFDLQQPLKIIQNKYCFHFNRLLKGKTNVKKSPLLFFHHPGGWAVLPVKQNDITNI